MLTALEANFVQEYKNTGSPTKALRSAGSKAKESSLPVLAYRMMRKPEIKKAIEEYSVNLVNTLTTPVLTKVNPVSMVDESKVKVINLPSREEYIDTAWKRQRDESNLKEETKFKYYDVAGRSLGYVKNNDEKNSGENVFQILCKELNLSLSQNPDPQPQHLVVDSDIRLTQNISDGKNIHTPSLSDIEGDTRNSQALASSDSVTQPIIDTVAHDVTEGKKIE